MTRPAMSFRAFALLIVVLAVGCSGADRPAADTADPPATGGTAASVPGFPMPDPPFGEEHVAGAVGHQASADQRASCAATAARADGLTAVTVTGLRMNCCTMAVRAGVQVRGDTATVRLYEYLPDLCECTHLRDVTFALRGLDGVTTIEILLNDRPTPAATARP